MPKNVRFYETGDAGVLKIEELPLVEPGVNEVRLKVEAIGLNRAEVLFRQGHYLENPEFPSRLGYEAAGIIDTIPPTGITSPSWHRGKRRYTLFKQDRSSSERS